MSHVSVAPTLRKFLSFLVFVAMLGSASAVEADDSATIQNPIGTVDLVWDTCEPSGFELPYDVATSPDGATLFVTGCGRPQGYCHDFLTAAYDSRTGNQLWIARHEGHYAAALAVSPDGSMVYVAGNASDRHPFGRVTIAYDAATGAQLWVGRFGDSRTESYPVSELVLSPDGSKLYVGGSAMRYGYSNYDFLTVAYDASKGLELWTARRDEAGAQVARSLAIDADGSTLFVGGGVPVAVAYDAETGEELWTYRLGGAAEAAPWVILPSPTGSEVVAVGRHVDQVAIVGIDPRDGKQLWILHRDRSWDISLGTIPAALSADGATLFLGTSYGGGPYPLYAATAIDLGSGEDRWETTGPGHLTSLAPNPSGSTMHVVADTSWGSTIRTYRLENGALLWARDRSGEHVGPNALATNPSGSMVFSTGDHVCEKGPIHHDLHAYAAPPGGRRTLERDATPSRNARVSLGRR